MRWTAGAVGTSLLLSVTGCHEYRPVLDPSLVVGTKGRVTLTAEGRASHARQLGGVAMDVDGTVAALPGDSIEIKADVVHFADLGDVPFAGGTLRFATKEVAGLAREQLNRKRSTLFAIAGTVAAIAVAAILSPRTSSTGGVGPGNPPPK